MMGGGRVAWLRTKQSSQHLSFLCKISNADFLMPQNNLCDHTQEKRLKWPVYIIHALLIGSPRMLWNANKDGKYTLVSKEGYMRPKKKKKKKKKQLLSHHLKATTWVLRGGNYRQSCNNRAFFRSLSQGQLTLALNPPISWNNRTMTSPNVEILQELIRNFFKKKK